MIYSLNHHVYLHEIIVFAFDFIWFHFISYCNQNPEKNFCFRINIHKTK